MAYYHFTIHAYRSWRPDHPRGFTKKGEGYQRSDPDLADQYDKNAKQDPAIFDAETQRQILFLAHQICVEEGWQLQGAAFDEGHTHLVVGWREFNSWEDVDRRLKNLLALKLDRLRNSPGKRWFVRKHSAPRRVRDAKHLKYLMTTYLPDHPGVFWKIGMRPPTL